jgi:hypothetical protein
MTTPVRTAIAAAILALACDRDPVGPLAGDGELYVLRSVAGDDVPALILVGDYTSWEVVADSILLRDDGTGRQVVVRRAVYPDAPAAESVREVIDFEYQMDGTRITVSLPCADSPAATNSCLAPPHYSGTRADGAITFDLVLGYLTPFVFERVSPPRPTLP